MLLLSDAKIEEILVECDKGFNSPVDFASVREVVKCQLREMDRWLSRYYNGNVAT